MRNYRQTLPPLDLLVFFEAAHRIGSFTGCAAELNVSQAAVSKRIRQLEEWIGEPLFLRDNKKLQSTPAGDRLSQIASMGLDYLYQGITSLKDEVMRPLSIGANTAIGMFWLTPRLRQFGLSRNACPTRLVTSDHNRDLFTESNELVVAYGTGIAVGWQSMLLQEEELAPVVAPALIRRLGKKRIATLNDITISARSPLLNYPRSGPDWVDWRGWFAALSMAGIEDWPIQTLATYSQTIGEAIEGNGIALGSLTLLRPELEAGSLIRLTSDILKTGRGYYLYHSTKSPLSRDATNLANFLTTGARTSNTIL